MTRERNAKGQFVAGGRQLFQGLTMGFGDEANDATGAAIASLLTGQKYGDLYDEARKLSSDDLKNDVKNYPVTSGVANVAGSAISGAASSPKILAQALLGGVSGFGQGEGGLEKRLQSGAIGAGLGAGGQALSKGVNRVAKGASDLISPQARKIGQRLKDAGIPVRLSQLMDSKFLAAVDSAISKVPFSGAGKSQDQQRQAFTKALSNTFGEDSPIIDSDVLGNAKKRLGGEYDRLLGNNNIPIDRQAFAQRLSQMVDDLSLQTDDDGAAFLRKQADNILNTIDNGQGTLTGKSYQNLRRTLKGAAKKDYGVRDMLNSLDSEVRASVPDDIGKQLGGIDGQYRNMKIAEKLYGQLQNSSGTFKPETLYNAAKPNISNIGSGGGGDLGDLARDARLLKPTIPDSGTASQLAGMTALGSAGVGGLFNPAIAAGAAGTVGTAAALNKAMTSNYLQEGMSPAIQKATAALENSNIVPSVLRSAQQQAEDGAVAEAAPYNPDTDPELQKLLGTQEPPADPRFPTDGVDEQGLHITVPTGQTPYDPDQDPELQKLLAPEQHGQADTPNVMDRIAQAESGGDPNAKNPNSSASGTYQFTDPTWKAMVGKYGQKTGITEADKSKPDAQKIMAGLLADENGTYLKNKGFEASPENVYLAHFLGAGGAGKVLGNPDAIAASLLPKAAKANQNVFYKGGSALSGRQLQAEIARRLMNA